MLGLFKVFLPLLSLFCYCFSLGLQSQQLKVGAAMRNITPVPLIAVSGGVGIPKLANITTNLTLINIGTAQILTIPSEALPNTGYYLKRKMPTDHPFLFGLTNDAYGYILTKEDYNSFKPYEYITKTSLGEITGKILLTELLDLIKRSPRPDNNLTPSLN